MQEADQYLSFLHSLCDMGAVMMKVMGQALTNPAIYEAFIKSKYHFFFFLLLQLLRHLVKGINPQCWILFYGEITWLLAFCKVW